jgi:integrase
MEYPKGTQFGSYILCQDRPGKFTIRRQITLPTGKRIQPRYPRSKYRHLNSKEELQQLVNRLNHRQDQAAKREIEIRTSFIPQSLMDEFRDLLKLEIPNAKDFRYQYSKVFKSYFLHFFIHKLKVLDPNQWYQHQSQWGAALLGQAENPEHNVFAKKMSFKTISKTIQIANRFMALLHLKTPSEYNRVIFNPISRGAQNAYRAELQRKKNGTSIGRFIEPADWDKIRAKMPDDIRPFILLAYHYGLRRAESLGFENLESIKKGYLKITQQLIAVSMDKVCTYGALKDREQRQTPHWFCTPKDAYDWISEGLSRKMHPDTLGERWEAYMKQLGMDYDLHDLRRTFITRALRLYNPRDVQLAVGHASLTTTMGYAMDDRDHSDETFNPSAS